MAPFFFCFSSVRFLGCEVHVRLLSVTHSARGVGKRMRLTPTAKLGGANLSAIQSFHEDIKARYDADAKAAWAYRAKMAEIQERKVNPLENLTFRRSTAERMRNLLASKISSIAS